MNHYNEFIARQLQGNVSDFIKHTPQPLMMGGKIAREHPLSGFSVQTGEPSTLVVGGKASRRFTESNSEIKGAGINHLKKFKKWTKTLGDLVPESTRGALTNKVNRIIDGGKVNHLKKFKKWTSALGQMIPESTRGALVYKANKTINGGKVNHLNKFKKWTSTMAKMIPASTREALTNKANMLIGGKVNHLNKFKKWTSALSSLVPDSIKDKLTNKANMLIGGALQDEEEYNEMNDMEYPKGLMKVLKQGAGKRTGGRMVKGSAEAKAWGEKMKAARMAKR